MARLSAMRFVVLNKMIRFAALPGVNVGYHYHFYTKIFPAFT
jgi:hypothetical protein